MLSFVFDVSWAGSYRRVAIMPPLVELVIDYGRLWLRVEYVLEEVGVCSLKMPAVRWTTLRRNVGFAFAIKPDLTELGPDLSLQFL